MNRRGLDIGFVRMGAVSSDDLFEEREQGIFDLYEHLGDRYERALDIGANVGIHAILMGRQGWQVRAYEPDPEHYPRLVSNLMRNPCKGEVMAIQVAVSTEDGYAEFVRVLGNTTANHIAGAREHHGEVQRLRVPMISGPKLFEWNDFAKIDCEGHEAALLCATDPSVACEFLVEIGSPQNAEAIFFHFYGHRRSMWAQRGRDWCQVLMPQEMPKHYKDGGLFIGELP